MFFRFCMTRSKQTKFSSLSQRLVSCFSPRVLSLAIASLAVAPLPSVAGTIPVIPTPVYGVALVHQGLGSPPGSAPGTYANGGVSATLAGFPVARISATEHDSLGHSFVPIRRGGPSGFCPSPNVSHFQHGCLRVTSFVGGQFW
jgi:hypothetical protein